MKKSRLMALYAFTLGLVLSTTLWASPVTITSNSVGAAANDVTSDFDVTNPTAIPATDSVTATFANSSSTTNINYSGDTNSATFSYDIDHSINNSVGDTSTDDYAQSYNQFLLFTANAASTYSIDGIYGMTGPSGTRLYLDVYLFDVTDSLYLFRDFTESRSTDNDSFVLGMSGDGDYNNSTLGNLTGNLLAGHDYRFYFSSYIRAVDANSQVSQVAASASGDVNLHIEAVPVPSAVWLFASGLLGLVSAARRKK